MELIRAYNATGARVMALANGDIFTVKDLSVQFEDRNFYEVKFRGYDGYMQSLWERTGRVFNMDEMNDYTKSI